MDPTIESRSLPANRSSLLHAPALGGAWVGLHLLGALPFVVRHPPRPADAATAIAMRLEQRPSNLLRLLRRAVYDNPASPHRWLLHQAGCEFGDIAALIAREGDE